MTNLKKDYEFRKLVVEYLKWIFSLGVERCLAHDEICDYLIENWDIYAHVKGDDVKKRDVLNTLRLAMTEFITDDVIDSLGWATHENKSVHLSKHTKALVDKFCEKLEQMKPLLKADMDDDPLLLRFRYQNLDNYLNERRERNT